MSWATFNITDSKGMMWNMHLTHFKLVIDYVLANW
jgi:hypothetical protein